MVKNKGWPGEPARHGLAAKGIKTGRKKQRVREQLIRIHDSHGIIKAIIWSWGVVLHRPGQKPMAIDHETLDRIADEAHAVREGIVRIRDSHGMTKGIIWSWGIVIHQPWRGIVTIDRDTLDRIVNEMRE